MANLQKWSIGLKAARKFVSIDRIKVREPQVLDHKIITRFSVDGVDLLIKFNYSDDSTITKQDARIISVAPLVNYSLFTNELSTDFPLSNVDISFFREMMKINSREVYINKILKRREFFRPEIIPSVPDKSEADYIPILDIREGPAEPAPFPTNGSVGILSSGGKESLLSYGMMKEVGANVFPIYINESGGHWKTAKVAYDYMSKRDINTLRVWTTVDRFYREMNSRVDALDRKALKMWSDTYPIQLFIFPIYILSSLPYIRHHGISYVMKGDEFDDPRNMKEEFGMNHFYGVYDQTQAFDDRMTSYFREKGFGTSFFSGVRGISGYVEERILFRRYPEIARLQRSCHSCHSENGDMIPCGKCSKCNGVLLFLTANGIDPTIISYRKDDVKDFRRSFKDRKFRLDTDEMEHSIFVLTNGKEGKEHSHVEKIHQSGQCCDRANIPEEFRDKIMRIIREYTQGNTELINEEWV